MASSSSTTHQLPPSGAAAAAASTSSSHNNQSNSTISAFSAQPPKSERRPPTSLPGLTSPTSRPLSRKNSFTLPDVRASEYYRIYQESKSASSSRKNSFKG